MGVRSEEDIFGNLEPYRVRRDNYGFVERPRPQLDQLAERMRGVIKQIEAAGVQVPPSSRLWKYAKVLDGYRQFMVGPVSAVRGEVLYELADAYMELGHAIPAVAFILKCGPSCAWRLKDFVRGAPMAALEKDNSHRNHAFEAYMGGMFDRAGFEVRFEEPDLMILHEAEWIPVACKRVGTMTAYRERLPEACRQVAKHERRGIAVMEVSQACLNKDLPVLFTNDWNSTKYLLPDRLSRLEKEELPRLVRRCSRNLFAVFNVARCATVMGFQLEGDGWAYPKGTTSGIGAVPSSRAVPLDETYTEDSLKLLRISNQFLAAHVVREGDLGWESGEIGPSSNIN